MSMNHDLHFAVITCEHVLAGAPVLYVVHNRNGDWQMICGEDGHELEHARVVGFSHLLAGDASLEDLLDLPAGDEAERTDRPAAWVRRVHE